MKTLLVGLGQIGLGLIVPVFKKAGYEIIGTDVSTERLSQLRRGYILKTPSESSKLEPDMREMGDVVGGFDLVITSVGRNHLASVADWCKSKNISAPVLLAENLPDPINIFARQIPIVVDRICPRTVMENGNLTAFAEDYYKIAIFDSPLTHQLGKVPGVELETSEANVEMKRKQKMFTVNTSHVITALYGQQLACVFVEEAIKKPEVASRVESAVKEVGPWLGLDAHQAAIKSQEIIKRFASPLKDALSRILNENNRKSALRYVEIPLNGLRSLGKEAPMLEEAYNLLAA